MGVINVTPDSFSDPGVHFRVGPAVTAAWGMLDCGAAIVDVGGESTRPGSEGISAEQELERIEPVISDLKGAPLSVDTINRIHGSAKPSEIGSKKTAGCFGMLNIDIIHIYDRVAIGTRVVVLG